MNTHTPLFKTILFFIPLSLIIFFTGCSKTPDPLSKTGFYFDTVITITLYDKPDESILDGCFSLAETYENRLSKTKENSDVWNINHSGGKPTAVSEDTLAPRMPFLCGAFRWKGRSDYRAGYRIVGFFRLLPRRPPGSDRSGECFKPCGIRRDFYRRGHGTACGSRC